MLKKIFIFAASLFLVFIAITLLVLSKQSKNQEPLEEFSENSFIINNIRIFDGQKIIKNTNIEVINGLITSVNEVFLNDKNLPVINGKGKTIIPGLIDAHVHTYGTALSDNLRFGVTSSLDMFTDVGFFRAQKKKRNTRTSLQHDLFGAGMLATVDGGHGTQFGITIETLSVPNEAEQWVEKRVKEGSDFIKLVYMPYQKPIPSLDKETAQAIIKAAHKNGLLAVAHISTQQGAQDMLDAGIDGFVHIFADSIADEKLLSQMSAQAVFVIPTLAVIAGLNDSLETEKLIQSKNNSPFLSHTQKSSLKSRFTLESNAFNFTFAQKNIQLMHAAGIDILVGTDAPNPGTSHGISMHQEMELLKQSGMTSLEVIQAATSLVAERFALSDRGSIKPNQLADFLILNSNPQDNIEATQNIDAIYKNGFKVTRTLLTNLNEKSGLDADFGQFDKDLSGPNNLSWVSSSDNIAGGKSSAAISHAFKDTQRTDGYLHIEATINQGFPYPWAGTFLGPTNPTLGLQYDLSDYSAIQFDARGVPGQYRVMLFNGINGAPPTLGFTISQEWQTYTLAFEDFIGFNAEQFSGLSFSSSTEIGEYSFDLDNITLKK